MKIYRVFKVKKPVIGMIHLLPLVGYKKHSGMNVVISQALKDLEALESGGVDGVLVENDADQPHQVIVGPEIVVAMTQVVEAVVKKAKVSVGLEVLLNDPQASLAIAKAVGAKFIRTDYFVDRMARKEYGGEMKIDPVGLMNYRGKIKAESVLILTDVQVKHAKLLETGKPISKSVKQAIKSGSDGVIITGNWTGVEPNLTDLKEAKLVAKDFPTIVGSGVTEKNAVKLLDKADGAIVGSSLIEDHCVSKDKVIELMEKVKELRLKGLCSSGQ